MKWTSDAEERLGVYFERRFEHLEAGEFDREETESDIRAHVEEELRAKGAAVVTLESLQRVLAQMGDIDEAVADAPAGRGAVWNRRGEPAKAKAEAKPKRQPWEIGKKDLFVIMGIVLPLVVVLIELATGFCAGVFFDPLPTWWHALLVAAVPLGNLIAFRALRKLDAGAVRWALALSGAGLVVGGYYTVLVAPLMPMAIPALILAGIGFLPISVVTAWLASVVAWRRMVAACREGVVRGVAAGRLFWGGALVGLLALAALEGPSFVTREGLLMATSTDEAQRDRGIAMLRAVGSERTLLQACYELRGLRGGAVDTVGWVYSLARRVQPSDAQDVYYRVTGRAFNSVEPPRAILASKRGQTFDGFEWDSGEGGDEVAGRVSNLDLISSRVDSHIDESTALAYTEWTMVFRNSGTDQKEARFQAMLPPLGVVSGLSLWIDGEEREAAFSSRSKVKKAYKNVVQRRRDPVLVTTTGPDRVLVQCFPVPPRGGEMKIRFGVTCPLDRGVTPGRLWLPQIVERNFGIGEKLEHSVWVQARSDLESPLGTTADDAEASDYVELRSVLSHEVFQGANCYVDCSGAVAGEPVVWTADPFATGEGEALLVRRRDEETAVPVRRLVVVVDGSAPMEAHREAISGALLGVAEEVELTVILAGDRAEVLGDGREGASAVAKSDFEGGMDNVAGLAEGLGQAGRGGDAAVVWLHGPQPVLLAGADRLAQYFERTLRPIPLYSVPVVGGPNRVLEELQRQTSVRPGVRLAEVGGDLEVFLGQLKAGLTEPGYGWERPAEAPGDGVKVWDQLARYWAFGDVMEKYYAGEEPGEGTSQAARYQLVTPYSGAVVLETEEQFKAAGLEAIDAATAAAVPVIPEPSPALLTLVGLLWLAMGRRRRQSPGC